MSEIELRATYQGIDVLAMAIDRKPGLSTDVGWVEVGRDQLKGIDIKKDFRLWQAAGVGAETPGPLSIGAAVKILRNTVTASPPGLQGGRRAGPLIIKTLVDGQVMKDGSYKLDPLFIMPSGIQEIEKDLESAMEHKEGRVRFNLVDFRYFWEDYGTPLYGRINRLLPDGGYDPKTTQKNDPENPWLAKDVFAIVAAALPGSPRIHPASDVFAKGGGANLALPEPVNLEMKMERPVVWMKRLLDLYDLELHLTFDSRIYLKKRSGKHEPRKFRFGDPGGSPREMPKIASSNNPTSEVQTVYVNDSPEGVFVAGGIRQRRNTELCVPVFIDEYGQIHRMERLFFVWPPYNVRLAREQRLLHHAKSYEDLPGKDSLEKSKRIELARKYFFKLYAPLSSFRKSTPEDVRRIRGLDFSEVFWPIERERAPLLPMKPPWYTIGEAREQFADEKLGPIPKGPARKDALIQLSRVVVRATLIKQMYSKDEKSVMASVQSFLDQSEAFQASVKRFVEQQTDELKDLNVTPSAKKNGRSATGIWKHLGALEKFNAIVEEWADEVVEGGAFGSVARGKQAEHDATAFRAQRITQLQASIDQAQNHAANNLKTVSQVKANLEAIRRAIKNWGFARLWVNTPWGVVDKDSYSVTDSLGLIHFSEVAGSMNYAAVYDPEDAEMIDDGHVVATWMSDKVTESPEEMSYWVFQRNDIEGTPGPPKLCKVSDPTVLKPAIVEAEDLVLIENENGEAMNAERVTAAASRIAAGPLSYPRQQTGYTYEYPGLWAVVTDDATNHVQWTIQEDKETGDVWGHTTIRANNPDDQSLGFSSVSKKKYQEKLLFHE